jgi:DNA transformation protein
MAANTQHPTVQRLEDLPNVGKSIAGDLRSIGITCPQDMSGVEPLEIYNRLALAMGRRHDPCVLYTLLAVTDYLQGAPAQPWWKYTTAGKKLLQDSH